ncbi:MAG: citrate synthase [Ruminococcaceae bacterium]|jgi:citrate synthase|nr:citrate synthase [Oscillospiraceae bacterium]
MSVIAPISSNSLNSLWSEIKKNNYINPEYYSRFDVKRGLRNADDTGVMAGLTRICSVEGYYLSDGERVPKEGKLVYRGINIEEIVDNCIKENRFGFEEVAWLLILGQLPTENQLKEFNDILGSCRELPDDFIEDMIMKAPSPNVMNKAARSVLALYSFDEDPESTDIENVTRQCVQLIAQIPSIVSYAYQVKRRVYDHKSMYIHQVDPSMTTAQSILHYIRSDKKFTDEEAKLLDIALIVHAEHGGGNNSTFSTRCLTSSGTDTYSAFAAGIGALKGPKHGGANIKVRRMLNDMKNSIEDITDADQVASYLTKVIRKEANDGSGLVYGMGHAVYTLSDPRAKILKSCASRYAGNYGLEKEFTALSLIESLTPQVFEQVKGSKKKMCANVDLYSGLIYDILRIPEDLFTPMFLCARSAGWAAHRIEELLTNNRIIRPAFKNVAQPRDYVPINERTSDFELNQRDYIPQDER